MSERPRGQASPGPIAELERLRHEADGAARSRRAWEVVLGAAGAGDFPVVLDFALEHGLVLPCDAGGKQDGQAARPAVWLNPTDGSEMVWIPPGPFAVGAEGTPAESKGFSLARFPVTNAQFQRFLDATDYSPPDDHPNADYYLAHWADGGIPEGKETHPVVWVSFVDALHYCAWAGLTLPTEWLWEKAARGPDGRLYPWGDEPPRDSTVPLTNVRSADTCPVGSYPRTRTAYGCEDMIGNVSEWCQSLEGKGPGQVPEGLPEVRLDPEGPPVYTAVRGSCFLRNDPLRMVSSHRRRLSITRRNRWVGFRPALFLACRPAL
jgi:serine/threonine-protein kinase